MAQTTPIRGGLHPIYGLLFMGGSDLNSEYALKSPNPYKLTTQLRNAKQSSQSEQSLMNARTNASKIKFHGKLETSPDCATEYDKEEFLTCLKEQVSYYYGLQIFFAMPTSDGTMYNLLSFSHLFELQNVIEEYESRIVQHDPVLEANGDENKFLSLSGLDNMMSTNFSIEPFQG